MNRSELEDIAQAVENAFTVFAFRCECKGNSPDCRAVLNDEVEAAKYYQVQRIARFIREMDAKK